MLLGPIGYLVKVMTIILLLSPAAFAAEKDQQVFKKKILPLLEKYCYKCHDEDVQKGDFRIDTYKNANQILPNRKHWLKVLEQLETEEMPTKKPLPSAAEYEILTHWVDQAVNDIDWEKVKHPGHVTIPLLTNEEYFNSLEDVFGLDLRSFSKFSNDSEGLSGFTNDRDGLFVSTAKMEKYLASAEAAVDSLLAVQQSPQITRLESEKMFMTETSMKPRTIKGLTGYFLNRGQMSLYESVSVPADGLYEVSVRAVPANGDLAATSLRVDNDLKATIQLNKSEPQVYTERLYLAKGSRQFTWNIAEFKPLKSQLAPKRTPEEKALVEARERAKENVMSLPASLIDFSKKEKLQLESLNKTLRNLQVNFEELQVYGLKGPIGTITGLLKKVQKSIKQVQQEISKIDKKYKNKFIAEFTKLNAVKLKKINSAVSLFAKSIKDSKKKTVTVGIDWMQVKGPLKSPNTLNLNMTDDKGVEIFLKTLLPRLFRQSARSRDFEKYYQLYKKSRSAEESIRESLKLSLVAALVSPKFLFRNELKISEDVFALDDFQLASRLAYFLWMSTPDQELLSLAGEGKLKEEKILEKQIERMLKDSKSRRFSRAFAGEWLGFKSLGKSVMPDAKVFPTYTAEFNEAAKLEVVMMIEHLFQTNKSLLNLIDSTHSFVNSELAAHYGLEGVTGEELRLVELNNSQRGGLMGMTAILASTSNPGRTNPVNRGLWIFERLLGKHMAMPPADVPALAENAGSKKGVTLREEFEKHRENAACANCHNKIDPLGFGLENFDAIGRYRTKDNGQKIDASGKMPDGSTFNGIVELKKYIGKENRHEFLRNISKRLLSFALGRELHYYDEPAIKKIIAATEKDNYNSRTLLREVIKSFPFTHQSNKTEILGDVQ